MNFDQLTAFLDNLSSIGIAGNDCAVCVNGKLVYRHMTGYADIEADKPITADTIYQVYSMTKPITCAAMLQLYEQGKFLLSDPVSSYLPEYEDLMVRRVEEAGVVHLFKPKRPLRIQHLFTMSGGLNYDLNSASLQRLRTETPNYTTREFARALAGEPLDFEPGAHYQYSLCHDLLGALLEALSGMTFDAYAKKYIFEPLGMRDAHFHVPEEKLDRCAAKYSWSAQTQRFQRLPDANTHQSSPRFESGGAGLNCTVDDYVKFANALCDGGVGESGARILGKATIDMMRLNQLDETRLADFRDESKLGYGYGLGVRTLMDKALAGSAGGIGEFGWGGATGPYVLIDPAWGLTIVFAEHSLPGHNGYTHRRIRNLTYRALED